jgi:hypothetical protein
MVNCSKLQQSYGKLWQVLANSSNVYQILLKFIKKTIYIYVYITLIYLSCNYVQGPRTWIYANYSVKFNYI